MQDSRQPVAGECGHLVATLGRLCARDGNPPTVTDRDWPALLHGALQHGIAPLLYLRTREAAMPEATRAEFAQLYRRNVARNLLLAREQQAVLDQLRGAGIAAIALKGPAQAEQLFGDIGARQIADLDVLIRSTDLRSAVHALGGIGYWRSGAELPGDLRDCRDVLLEKDVQEGVRLPLDLHMRLRPYGKRDALADLIWREGITPENLLLATCLNVMSHRFARLLPWLDLAAVLSRYERELNWRQIQKKAIQLEWPGGVFTCLQYVSGWEIARVPDSVLTALKPSGLERRWIRKSLGPTLHALLARAEQLDGPRGTMATLACEKGWLGKVRLAAAILFPAPATLRQMDSPARLRSLPLHYADRAARKLRQITRRAA